MLPGLLTWSVLVLPFILSQLSPRLNVVFILGFLLLWFAKSIGLDVRAIQGYRMMKLHQSLPWGQMALELSEAKVGQPSTTLPTWHYENVRRAQEQGLARPPDKIVHALIIATYNESREVLEPTVLSILESDYDSKRLILLIAYEERGGPDVAARAHQLVKDYGHHFLYAQAVEHPAGRPGEVIGKGGNISWAGRHLQQYCQRQGIESDKVIVTTLDADNRPHPKYLPALTYYYCMASNPVNVSFQPIPMFTNNIWDAPAPMRVIATGNSFWNIILSLRPHMIRNFSSHAQSLQTLIDTDFWSVRTIVEDGHQFWRTYFRYDGDHQVYPIYLPIYQDAVLAATYWRTLKAQFIQLRRWAWGATDIAYVIETGYFKPNRVPKLDLTFKTLRLIESHISWATAPLILAFSAFVPSLFNPRSYAAAILPVIASRVQTLALIGIFITLYLSLKMLPPKPARYKRSRTVGMVLQWVMLPITTICYNSLAALYSQTRLLLGKYYGAFDVTEKAVVVGSQDKQTRRP